MSNNGGKTWTADRPLHTSGYSEAPNPYLIAHGFPDGDRLHLDHERRRGSDRSERARRLDLRGRRVGPHYLWGPATVQLHRPPGRDRSGPVDQRRSDLRSDQRCPDRPGSARDGQSGDEPRRESRSSGSTRSTVRGSRSTSRPVLSTYRPPRIRNATSPFPMTRPEHGDGSRRSTATRRRRPTPTTMSSATRIPKSGDGNIAAAHGVLAAGYTSSAAPASTCPCAVFETSTDAGAHWNRHVVSDRLPSGVGHVRCRRPVAQGSLRAYCSCPGLRSPAVSPAFRRRRTSPKKSRSLTTTNSGSTWSTPTTLGNESVQHITNRPWIAYGPTGVLAALWRNAYPPYNPTSFLAPGTQNVFAAVSRNNGKTFSAPVQLNSAPSPPPDPQQLAEDDVSWVAVTPQYVYGAWGDWRPTAKNPVAAGSSPPSGELNSWIARVPISSFRTQ